MALYPFSSGFLRGFEPTPVERYFNRFFDEAVREARMLEREGMRPYWLNHQNPLTLANTIGGITDDKDKYSVSVDVSQFTPQELKVSTRDRQIVIEGHHEEKSDEQGQIERHFVRKYLLPKDVNPEAIQSQLSPEGVLTVTAAKREALEGARQIPIQAGPTQMTQEQQKRLEHNKHKSVEENKH